MSDIETRLAAVEKSVRRWRVAFVVLAVAGLAAFHFGAATDVSEVVRTRKLEVVDSVGQSRLLLDTDAQGGHVSVMNKDNKKAIAVDADYLGGSIEVGGREFKDSYVLIMGDETIGGAMTICRDNTDTIRLQTDPMVTPNIDAELDGKQVWRSPFRSTFHNAP